MFSEMEIGMKTAAYIGKLQSVGVDPKVAQAHGEALENAVGDTYVTKEFLSNRLEVTEARTDAKIDTLESRIDSKIDTLESRIDGKLVALESRMDAKFDALESRIDAKFDNFKAQFFQAMFLQGIAIVGLTAGLIKMMK
jgi:hypothetical protein